MIVTAIEPSKAGRMMELCEERYQQLISGGCDSEVAADRTYDALCAAFGEVEHAYDRRDRLFENKLRAVAERSA